MICRVAVRLGEHDINTVEDLLRNAPEPFTVQDIAVKNYVSYPWYDDQRKINDIGLIRLATPADLKKPNIATICLPVEEDNQFEELETVEAEAKDNMLIAGLWITSKCLEMTYTIFEGWGLTEDGQKSNVLIKGLVSYIDSDNCTRTLKTLPIFDSHICARSKSYGKVDTCQGDSGKSFLNKILICAKFYCQ